MTDPILDTKEPTPKDITPDPTKDTGDNKEFLDMLPDELKEVPALKSVKNTVDLATQFVNQQSLLGNSLRIPSEDTSEEQRNAFYQKLMDVPGVVRVPDDDAPDEDKKAFYKRMGVPESADGYKIDTPEGVTLESDYIQKVTSKAHRLGLTNKQLNDIVADDLKASSQAEEDYTSYINKSRAALKAIWSSDYDARVAGATNAMRIYNKEMPEFAEELSAVADNPLFIKILSDLGEHLQEKGHAGMQEAGNYGISVAEAKEKISEIMGNPDHPYFKGDQDAVERMLKYHEVVAGGTA